MDMLDNLNRSQTAADASGMALAILDRLPVGSMLLDHSLRVNFWSGWLNDWAGVSVGGAEGKLLGSLFPAVLETEFSATVDAVIRTQQDIHWSQSAEPELLDSIEQAFTGGSRELPLHNIAFLSLTLPEYGSCCLVQLTEAPFDSLIKSGSEASLERIFQQREILSTVCDQVADGVLLLDKRGIVEHINPVGRQLLGVIETAASLPHINDLMALENEVGEPLELPSSAALERGAASFTMENTLLSGSGADAIPVIVTATPLRDSENQLTGCVVVIRAVNEARHLSSRLHWQASHDPLTQLGNRRLLETELVSAIENAQKNNTIHTLLYIDMYNFSVVNDTCGHKAGDELLRRFARLLESQVSSKDVVTRIGSDEFAVLINERSVEDARSVAENMVWEIKAFSFPWDERRLKIGASIGAKVIDRTASSEIDVLLAAGASCGLAKEAGRNRIHFHYRSMEVMQRQSIVDWIPKITEALEDNRFELYCQPIAPINDINGVRHYEVLARMLDKQGNSIKPGNFIPAAEHYSLIEDIDRWVFDHLLDYLVELQQAGKDTGARFAVNLSGFSVGDEALKDHLISRFRETGIDPKRIQFEITETTAIRHFDRAIHLIDALKNEGCTFALDDFGNGLSSLGYLKQLPVDYLKIDGSFIRVMATSDVDYSMVSTINHLGQIMGISTIAECVETKEQLEMLEEIGVDYIQGYFIAKPQPIASLFS